MSVLKAGLENSFGVLRLVLIHVDNSLSIQHFSVKNTNPALKHCFLHRRLRVVRMSEHGVCDGEQYLSSNFNFKGRARREWWLKKRESATTFTLVDENFCQLDTKSGG